MTFVVFYSNGLVIPYMVMVFVTINWKLKNLPQYMKLVKSVTLVFRNQFPYCFVSLIDNDLVFKKDIPWFVSF